MQRDMSRLEGKSTWVHLMPGLIRAHSSVHCGEQYFNSAQPDCPVITQASQDPKTASEDWNQSPLARMKAARQDKSKPSMRSIPFFPALLIVYMYSVILKCITFSYIRNNLNFKDSPSRAGTTVTLDVHNIAFLFVLASRTRKNTSTPPLFYEAASKLVDTCYIEYIKYFRALIPMLEAPHPKGTQGQAALLRAGTFECTHFFVLGLIAWVVDTHSKEYTKYLESLSQYPRPPAQGQAALESRQSWHSWGQAVLCMGALGQAG